MKNLFPFALLLCSFSLFGQLDTMIVYDLATQTYEVIPPVEFDETITNDKTTSFLGTLDGFTALSDEVPTENLLPGTDFTNLTKTADLFDLSHYPMRTSVKLEGLSMMDQNFSCSGTLIAENIVLTATHCTFDYFTNIEFLLKSMEVFPSFDDGEIAQGFPSANVTKVFITKKSFDGNGYYDVCLLLLDQPIGASLGYQGIGFAPAEDLVEKVFHKISYPAGENDVDPTFFHNGDTTYYNYGSMSYNLLFGTLYLDASSPTALGIPGQSGSGLFESLDEEQTIFGVMSFTNYSHPLITPNYFYQFKSIIEEYNIVTAVAPIKNSIPLQINPNPFARETTVVLPNDLTAVLRYQLMDLVGRRVQEGRIEDQTLRVKRGDLASGSYILAIFLENGAVISEQIVIR